MKTFSPKLDKISEDIIYALSINSRTSITNLARKLSKSRRIVENRYKKLFKKGFLKHLLVSNEKGRIRATFLIRLSHFDEKLIENIKKVSPLLKLKETLGAYDLSLLIDLTEESNIDNVITKVSRMCGNKIISFDVLRHDFEDALGYKSFCHNDALLQDFSMMLPKNKGLTNQERWILDILKKEAKINYKSLGKKTNLSYNIIREAISRMLKDNVVRFSVDPDYDLLGLQFHNMLVKINPARKKIFESYLIRHPRVHWVKRSIGVWDYVLSITSRTVNEFIDITKQIRFENKNTLLRSSALVSKIDLMRRF